MFFLTLLCIAEMKNSSFEGLILSLLGKKLTGLHLEPFYALSLGLEQFCAFIFLPIFHPVLIVIYSCNGLFSRAFDPDPLFEIIFLFFSHIYIVHQVLLLLVEVFLCTQHA